MVPQAGSKSWTWDGKDATGRTMPDGAYKVVVKAADGSDVPFDPLGIATGVQRNGDTMQVALGGLSVDLSAVQSVGAK